MKRPPLLLALLACVCISSVQCQTPSTLAETTEQLRPLQALRLFKSAPMPELAHWADSVYNSLDLSARVGQLIMPIIYPRLQDSSLLIQRLKREQWGGILFQRGVLAEQSQLTQQLQSASQVPLLIALDGEWGLYMRLKDAPRYPRNKGLGQHGDLALVERYGREVARQCQLMGIHINFAPDADVNINPNNPVIGTRSFGDTPEQVARCVAAYARGLEAGGVLSVAKHFPGHGDTSEDSHKTLPLVRASRQRIEAVEFYPFKQYIEQGFGGIMTGHLSVPVLDTSGIASSLSPRITHELLRKQMGFNGLIITDALEMQGAQVPKGRSLAVQALLAGNDILLGLRDPEAGRREIIEAIRAGQISEDIIREHCLRILAFKYVLIHRNRHMTAAPTEVKKLIWNESERRLREELWRASSTSGGESDPTQSTPALSVQRR